MRCLCCNKIINENNITEQEKLYSWHNKCIKQFFGTSIFPTIDLSNQSINNYVNKSINNQTLVPGVQKKLLLGFNDYLSQYILKPQTKEYPSLPELEYVSMTLAKALDINTVPFGLIKVNNEYAYITKRIDRFKDQDNNIHLYPMEDFCQLSNKLTIDKYHGSYEQCSKIINKYSSREGIDKIELFLLVLYSYLIGNSDMHLKNLSIIAEDGINYHLSSSYDLLSVKLVLKEDLDDLALTINGKNRNLTKNDFIKFGENIGIPQLTINKLINNMISKKTIMFDIINDSVLNNNLKQEFIDFIEQRINIFNNIK